MADIPQYVSKEVLRPNDMAEQAYAQLGYHTERLAGQLGHFGEVVGGLVERYQAHQEQAQTSAMMSDMSGLTIQAHKDLIDTLNNSDTSSSINPLEQYHADLQDKLSKLGEKYDNPKTQLVFKRMSDELTQGLMDSGLSQWDAKVKADTTTNLQQSSASYANAASLDPASADRLAALSSSAIDAMKEQHPDAFGKADVDRFKRQSAEGIYNAAGIRLVDTINSNPNASLADIQMVRTILAGDNFRNNMSPNDYARVLNDLDKAHLTRESAASLMIKNNMPDMLKQVEQFGDPGGLVPKYIAAYKAHDPEHTAADQAEMQRNYEDAQAKHVQTQVMEDLPQAQVAQHLADLKSAYSAETDPNKIGPARTSYEMAVAVAKKRDEEFFKSPATYMLSHNDTVSALYLKYQQTPTPQNFQTYAAFSAAQQQHLYPNEVPNVVTDDMKRDIQGKMAQIEQTPQGAVAAAQTLAQLKQTTGQFYVGAVHELMKAKVISPSQYVAGVLFNRPESQMLAQEVLQSASVPKDTMEKTSPLDESHAIAIARAAYAPLASTMKGTVNGDDLLDSYISSTAAVLRQRAVNAGSSYLGTKYTGAVASDASAIANQMVLGRYNIKNGMRIPSGFDAGDVTHGAQSVINDLGNHNLISSPQYGTLINGGQQYTKDVQSDGYWVTNPKGDGAILYFQGAPVQERGPKNAVQAVELKFDKMAQLGKQNRGPLEQTERFFTNPGSL